MNAERIKLIFILSISGIILLAGIWMAFESFPLYFMGERADGVVVDLIDKPGRGINIARLIEFETEEGETITYEEDWTTSSNSPSRFFARFTGGDTGNPLSVGKKVEVRYDPDNPESALTEDVFTAVLLPCIFLGLGGLAFGATAFQAAKDKFEI